MFTAHGASHPGNVRKINEDSWRLDLDLGVFLVADGMGGHNAGEVASEMAVETMLSFLRRTYDGDDVTWPYGIDPKLSFEGNRLITAVRLGNRRVFKAAESRDEFTGMGTTIVAALIDEDRLVFSGVGDSRIYALTDGTFVQLTTDDSWVASLRKGDPSAELAGERGALCHVDACLGGWLLPFLERLGEPLPPWDFRVDGVTSLSADIHKYGWCFKGASLLLHRDEDMLALQYFLFDGWPGGLYGSATTAGTRPAAPIAAAWATISHLGMDGYLRLAERVREASAALRAGVAAVPGLRVTGYPVPGVLEIAADESVDIGAVADVLEDRGWHLDRQQGGLHAIVSPSHVDAAPDLLADLADAVARHGESRGVEARYGGIG